MAAVLIVLVAALVAWVVTLGGGGAGKKQDSDAGGPAPATSITPGPGGSGPAISQEPGGRDQSDGGSGASGGDDGGKNGDKAGSGGSAGSGGGAGSGGSVGSAGSGGAGPAGSAGAGGTGSASGSAGSTGAGGTAGAGGGAGAGGVAVARQVGSGSSLPTCGPNALRVTFSSSKVAYAPDEKPQFKLMVTNSSATTCKVNLGPKTMVLTITNAGDDRIWTSKDCPRTTEMYFEVPAHSTVTHTMTWNRRHSTTKCSAHTPPAAGAGTYLAQLTSSVTTVPQAQSEKSIRLDRD